MDDTGSDGKGVWQPEGPLEQIQWQVTVALPLLQHRKFGCYCQSGSPVPRSGCALCQQKILCEDDYSRVAVGALIEQVPQVYDRERIPQKQQ